MDLTAVQWTSHQTIATYFKIVPWNSHQTIAMYRNTIIAIFTSG